MLNKAMVDYTLYLVTDSSNRDTESFCAILEKALQGGVTLVQLREKTATSRDFFQLALRAKVIADRYHVPLIINDRLDIAQAVDAAGLHIGQDDLPVAVARNLLGPDKILGATAATVADALTAQKEGADYLGSGAVYPTGTKPGKAILPLEVLKQIKQSVQIPVVAIGGIGADNIAPLRTVGVDGVAIVSAIMDSSDPEQAARTLNSLWRRIS